MILFNADKGSEVSSRSVLKHLGSQLAAARRIESMFSAQELRMYRDDGMFTVCNCYGVPKRTESLDKSLALFSEFARGHTIKEYDVSISEPLTLFDCWDDDPIASGGMEIFKGNENLTCKQMEELKAIFSPFEGIIYPDSVHRLIPIKKIKELSRLGKTNEIFKSEISKRKRRLIALDSYSKDEMYHEVIWVDLTLRVRLWALDNGFDAFVYKNVSEGDGEDSFVTLQPKQTLEPVAEHVFDKEKYLDIVGPIFPEYVSRISKGPRESVMQTVPHVFWAGQNPVSFWR